MFSIFATASLKNKILDAGNNMSEVTKELKDKISEVKSNLKEWNDLRELAVKAKKSTAQIDFAISQVEDELNRLNMEANKAEIEPKGIAMGEFLKKIGIRGRYAGVWTITDDAVGFKFSNARGRKPDEVETEEKK